jgi:hypothetical protein
MRFGAPGAYALELGAGAAVLGNVACIDIELSKVLPVTRFARDLRHEI